MKEYEEKNSDSDLESEFESGFYKFQCKMCDKKFVKSIFMCESIFLSSFGQFHMDKKCIFM